MMYSKGFSPDKIAIPPEYDGNALTENDTPQAENANENIDFAEPYAENPTDISTSVPSRTASVLDGIGTEDLILIAAVAAIFLIGENNGILAVAIAIAAVLI